MQDLARSHVTPAHSARALAAITEIAKSDLAGTTDTCRAAQATNCFQELERQLTRLYAISLEQGHPLLPDLIDELLRWIEAVTPQPARSGDWFQG